jgi:hypothetical protein
MPGISCFAVESCDAGIPGMSGLPAESRMSGIVGIACFVVSVIPVMSCITGSARAFDDSAGVVDFTLPPAVAGVEVRLAAGFVARFVEGFVDLAPDGFTGLGFAALAGAGICMPGMPGM